MHSVKKVKKVLTRTLPRYHLRSRKRYAPLFKPVVSVADQETQADLSDEDCEALFAELPFIFFQVPKAIPKLKSTLIRVQVIRIQSHKFQRHPDVQPRILYPHSRRNPLCARATLKNNFTTHTHPGLASDDRISSAHFTLNIQKKKLVIPILTTNQTSPLTVEITPYSYHLW